MLSLAGVVLLFFNESVLKQISIFLVAFSAGALMGAAFLHLLPEAIAEGLVDGMFIYPLFGFVGFFLLEKILHWHHTHRDDAEHAPLGVLSLVGDGMHNFLDGIILAAAFLVDIKLGVAATAAVALHEIPQEISEWVQKPLDTQSLFSALERVIGRDNRSPRIMVVEDDNDMAEILITMLNRHNIETFHARTGKQAIEFSQTVMPDLLVLDLALPEADGFEVVEWLRKHDRLRKMPLVVYTAKDLDSSDRERLKLGQTYFFTKGRISPEDFESRVIGLINRVIPHIPHKEGVTANDS